MTDDFAARRDDVLAATLRHVPALGWTPRAVRAALADTGADPDDADLLFPHGPDELVAAFLAHIDRQMTADAAAADIAGLSLSKRVRAVIALRLACLRPHRDAARLALGLLALPYGAWRATKAAAASIDAIWHAAGDPLDGFAGITKRATLATAYGATLLVWLRDTSDDDGPSLAFLDRRLAGIGRFNRFTKRLRSCLP